MSNIFYTSVLATLIMSFIGYTRADECTPVQTAPEFNLQSYVNGRWYVHQQAETMYLPKERFYCVHADYNIRDEKTFWGYTVDVMNYAEDEEGKSYGGDLCAINDKSGDPAKLNVAPCFLPTSFAGPYWVLAYDESEGYALIVGGQPTQVTSDGLCIPSEGVNESGLWIFLRSQERNETLINKVRDIATSQKIDVSILLDVDQTNCT